MMKAENDEGSSTKIRNDPSKYSIKPHSAHNTLVLNKGNVCGAMHIMDTPIKPIKDIPKPRIGEEEHMMTAIPYIIQYKIDDYYLDFSVLHQRKKTQRTKVLLPSFR